MAMVRGYGVFRVGRGDTRTARAFAVLLRLPPAGDAVETRLIVTPAGDGELWLRTFGTHALNTRQYPIGDGCFAERHGVVEFRFRREPCHGGTIFRQLDCAIVVGPLRAGLPRWCAPNVAAREDRLGERRVRIDVCVSLPLVGPIIRYAGEIDLEVGERSDAHPSREQAQRNEPGERSAPAKRRAREPVGESERQSPSDEI